MFYPYPLTEGSRNVQETKHQMTQTDSPAPFTHIIRITDLGGAEHDVTLVPEPTQLAAIAAELGLDGLRKMRFQARLAPMGKRDWRLTAHLGATVVQPCVVTLVPVTTRLEEDVTRSWRAGIEPIDANEVEMPEDDGEEPLGTEIDLGAVMVETLALALPMYPHAEGAALQTANFTEPGKKAMTDEEARPFAGLAGLKSALESDNDPENTD